jgi:hypothetical protein
MAAQNQWMFQATRYFILKKILSSLFRQENRPKNTEKKILISPKPNRLGAAMVGGFK